MPKEDIVKKLTPTFFIKVSGSTFHRTLLKQSSKITLKNCNYY